MRLDGKVAIITGTASGIGRASAVLFAREGASVALADWNDAWGAEAAAGIQAEGGQAIFIHTDVSKAADVQHMIRQTVRTFGKLDILVSNAACVKSSVPVAQLSEDEWDEKVDITLKGCYLCARYAIPHMIQGGGGVIVNVSSVGGLVAFESDPAYLAAKGGVIQLTKGIAADYARQGIRANVLCPGPIDTPGTAWAKAQPDLLERVATRTLLGRYGTSEEMAYAILFLACDESSYVTGSVLVADGGWTVL